MRVLRRQLKSSLFFAWWLWPTVLGACATLPNGRAESSLYVDVRKVVELREGGEWVVDRLEVEAVAASAMRSVCQVDGPSRQRLLAWLETQIAAEGGPAQAMFARDADADIDAVLTLERVRAVLRYAEEHAHECPFWLRPDAAFSGVQSDAYRWVVLADSVGGGGMIISDGDVRLGGGGGARLSLGLGVNQRYTLALGAEVGGIASFASSDSGGGRTLAGRFNAAVPLLLRIHNMSRVLDLEVAATARWSIDEVRVPPGARVAIGYGISTARLGAFMPSATVRLSFEVLPASHELPAEYLLFLGTKVGVDIDP